MRHVIRDLPASKIREVANAGIGRDDVLPFWFGESDEVTPAFIREAAVRIARRGRNLLFPQPGLAPSCARRWRGYVSALHRPLGPERIAVTSSGVNALMLAMQALVGAGDEVVAVTPVWPNLTAQPAILGARVVRRALAAGAAGPGGSTWMRCAAPSPPARACCSSMRRTTRPAGRSPAPSSRRCSTIAGAPAPGSSPTRSTSGLLRRRRRAARPASWTSPSPTTGWSWCTASPRAS